MSKQRLLDLLRAKKYGSNLTYRVTKDGEVVGGNMDPDLEPPPSAPIGEQTYEVIIVDDDTEKDPRMGDGHILIDYEQPFVPKGMGRFSQKKKSHK